MWSAVAAQRSTVVALPGGSLRQLAREIPDLALALIDALVFKARCYAGLAQMLGTRSITERLAQLLLYLAETYGVPEPDGTMIAAAFSHSDLANLVGATRQWVTISLARLQRAGALQYKRRFVVIRRPELLRGGTLEEP
jgi:CRP-like cAMP-binding protein